MHAQINFAGLFLLWLCLLALAAMLVVAIQAHRLEAEHGLRQTRKRIVLSAALLLVAFLVVFTTTYLAIVQPEPRMIPISSPVAPAPAPIVVTPEVEQLRKQAAEFQQKLEDLKAEQQSLDAEAQAVRKKLEAAGASPAGQIEPADTEQTVRVASWNLATPATIVAPLLALAGVSILFLLGDSRTLLMVLRPRGEMTGRRLQALTALDEMTAAVDHGRYADALNQADDLDDKALDPLDWLDWVYLKCFAAVQLASGAQPEEVGKLAGFDSPSALDAAVRDLEGLLEDAPERIEAKYLLAEAHGLAGRYEQSLALFTACDAELKGLSLLTTHNRSVCLLHLAEERLSKGDVSAADRHFSEVIQLNLMADQVPTMWVRVRFQNVRQALHSNQAERAVEELAKVRAVERLSDEQRRKVELICMAFESVIPLRDGNDAEAAGRIEAFLRDSLPEPLWNVGEEIVDEMLESPVSEQTLPLSPDVYRALLITLAATRIRLLIRHRQPVAESDVETLVKPLYMALEFQLRHRDVLAALGGIYYWLRPKQRETALLWLRTAREMGVQSRAVVRILEYDQLREVEQRQTLDWFRSKSSRFLTDPTLKRQVRQALIQELGQFREFKPMLVELEDSLEQTPQEPTLKRIRDRALYLDRLVEDLSARKQPSELKQLATLRSEYGALLKVIEDSTTHLTEIEKNVLLEIGKSVFEP